MILVTSVELNLKLHSFNLRMKPEPKVRLKVENSTKIDLKFESAAEIQSRKTSHVIETPR